MEEIIRVLSISDKWMTKKNLQDTLVAANQRLSDILKRSSNAGEMF
ncbi:hypothetical protein HSIEG1_3046 [Enterococcus sp. HSIEG1]|nr:hypothetical protein HSIEG1_3046 [Enterococcus sp. HSIEG1]